jgi:hypothetical protein
MLHGRRSASAQILSAAVMAGALVVLAPAARAWILTGLGTNNPARVFMMVGNGAAALWQNNATINTVSLSVPAAQLGTGPLTMTSNSTQATSPYDNYTVCTPPAQVYVGAAYQRRLSSQPANAVLQVNSPANLSSASGDTIPIDEISWTVSALGNDPNPTSIPAGTFSGGTQFLVNVAQGTLRENCHTFHFANTAIRASGVYTGRVTYTIAVP